MSRNDEEGTEKGRPALEIELPTPQVFGNVDEDDIDVVASAAAPPALPSPSAAARKGTAGALNGNSPVCSGRCLRHWVCVGIKSFGALGLAIAMGMAFIDWRVVEDSFVLRTRLLTSIFVGSLLFVALEDVLEANKSAVTLLSAGVMWTILAVSDHPDESVQGAEKLNHQTQAGLEEVGKILLFLLPAMGVCESVDHFNGFIPVAVLIRWLMAGSKERLKPIICLLTFTLCIVVDSMSATIVSLKIVRRLVPDDEYCRRQCGALVVLGANACVWSPIGEVTTAMLWIAGRITPPKIAAWLILPSVTSLLVPLGGICLMSLRRQEQLRLAREFGHRQAKPGTAPQSRKGNASAASSDAEAFDEELANERPELEEINLISDGISDAGTVDERITRGNVTALCLGIGSILSVPVLKMHTGLPPYFGMLFALGLMWAVTDALGLEPAGVAEGDASAKSAAPHGGPSGVMAALHKVDIAGLLFFAGVLQSVAALDSANILRSYAEKLRNSFGASPVAISTLLGLSSALVDNVPLVEAAIDMFEGVPVDDPLWQLVALCAGNGGSLLSTGGIAGVTFMSMEGVSFLWYMRNVSLWALTGFFSGIAVYQLQRLIVG
eukprot:TRINITY_DN65007_c0_g1_i1.p1 TRINITY_DN65007_c0_g1~~TRINITY_DN65007_c0_g1_i1.p1  ORF type:complete len:609 (+),score=125.96 TRINITY_DN65007_c0_g1_i1:91-1917(+)